MTAVLREIIRLLASEEAGERDRGADQVTDVLQSLTSDHVVMLARLLVFARLNEADASCQESQLNALAHLDSMEPLEPSILVPLRSLGPLFGSQREHRDELINR